MPDLFTFNDYRAYIRARVESEANAWGIWARLAKAAGCQPPYLSQAMKDKVHLTADHLHGIARHWELTTEQTDFLLLLHDWSKAATKELRAFYGGKVERIRREREDIAKRLQKPRFETGEKEMLYYSSWMWAALHVIVLIPEFQTATAIAQRLSLPLAMVEYSLQKLAELGVLKFEKARWRTTAADVHLPRHSPMIGMHHMNWRQRAVNDSLMPDADGLHFTAVYALSVSDFQVLKDKMLGLIEESRRVIAPSPEEEMVCMTCDLFKV